MYNVYVKDLIEICDCKLLWGNESELIKDCFVDTRKTVAGGCFFGIPGDKVNGSLYYKDAVTCGAKICILDEKIEINYEVCKNVTILTSKDVLLSLQKLASYKRSLFKGDVIAITGSVGKTSTKNLISSILGIRYKVLSTIKSENSQIGLPLTILRLKDEDIMVLELGMNKKGQMHNLSSISKPNIVIITNVLSSHIGNFKTRKKILKAKLEILDGMKGKTIILNNDNDLLNKYKNKKYNVITYGINNKSDYMANNIIEDVRTSFDTNGVKGLNILGGKQYIYNFLAAMIIGKLYNINDKLIRKTINNYTSHDHRLEIIKLKNEITIIDDSYNASYESVCAALDFLSKLKGRKVAVLGDILELGSKSKKIHKDIGKFIKQIKIDELITIGNDARYIGSNASIPTVHFEDLNMAEKYIKNIMKNKTNFLFKASNAVNLKSLIKRLCDLHK